MGLLSNILKLNTLRNESYNILGFIRKELAGIDGVLWTSEEDGHIFATKGRSDVYPTFICYLKSFQHLEAFEPRRLPHNIWVGVNENGPIGLTAPVKCGTFILLSLLKQLDNVKCIFYNTDSILSETAIGVKSTFFDNSSVIIEPTYPGRGKVIVQSMGNKYCSEVCQTALEGIGKKYGFETDGGTRSVFCRLRESKTTTISAVGLSVGYYEPYSKYEHVVEADLFKALDFCKVIANTMNKSMYYNVLFDNKVKTDSTGMSFKICQNAGCHRHLVISNQFYCPMCVFSLKALKSTCMVCKHNILTEPKEIFLNKCNNCFEQTTNLMFG